jgi:hypothetical protein
MDFKFKLQRLQETAPQDKSKGHGPILSQINLLQNTLKRQRNLEEALFCFMCKNIMKI